MLVIILSNNILWWLWMSVMVFVIIVKDVIDIYDYNEFMINS